MTVRNYTISFTVKAAPQAVFEAICNPRGWWAKSILGDADRLSSIFYHHVQDVHRCTMQVTELELDRKAVWHVLHNDFNFVRDKREWNGTDVVFELSPKGNGTEVKFTHVGLEPEHECYEVCAESWSRYLKSSLRDFAEKGVGQPDPYEDIVSRARAMQSEMRSNPRALVANA